jgi:hypothetical protein
MISYLLLVIGMVWVTRGRMVKGGVPGPKTVLVTGFLQTDLGQTNSFDGTRTVIEPS